ncbi:hypothetical protein BDN72DRAFT_724653, partial [Pluteus cervinus]
KEEIVLGQPWLQWYCGNIKYDRSGKVILSLWEEGHGIGDLSVPPSLTLQICSPKDPRNVTKVNLSGDQGTARIEVIEDSDS